MTMDDFVTDMAARAFAAYAESNPRLKELAEKDSDGITTEAEEAEFFRLLNKAEEEFFGEELYPFDDEPPIDQFKPWWK